MTIVPDESRTDTQSFGVNVLVLAKTLSNPAGAGDASLARHIKAPMRPESPGW